MTKIRKQKRKKRFRANVNRKRLRNKLQKLPKIECEDIENSWELKRSIRTNLKDMGLAYDPNEVLKIPSTKRGTIKVVKRDKSGVPKEIEIEEEDDEDEDEISENNNNNNNLKRDKIHVVNKLEADAKAPRERLFRLPKGQVQFVTYLMEKYGDDYKAMARDRKNHYQLTWCQIRNKINSFKSIPEQYGEYLLKTGEIVLEDPETLEETKRKLGEENLKKYCAPKKRKIQETKSKESFWEVESIENDNDNEEIEKEKEEFDNMKEKKTETSNGLKKLKLFSDDELSEDDNEEEEGNDKKKKKRKKNEGNGNKKLESKEMIKNTNAKKQISGNNSVPLKTGPIEAQNVKKVEKNVGKDLIKNVKNLYNKKIEKSQSSDSDSEEFEGDDDDDDADGFINLSDIDDDDEEELSEDDVLDDGEFVTDEENDSD